MSDLIDAGNDLVTALQQGNAYLSEIAVAKWAAAVAVEDGADPVKLEALKVEVDRALRSPAPQEVSVDVLGNRKPNLSQVEEFKPEPAKPEPAKPEVEEALPA